MTNSNSNPLINHLNSRDAFKYFAEIDFTNNDNNDNDIGYFPFEKQKTR